MQEGKTIPIKAKWCAVMPMLIILLKTGTPEGKKEASEELMRLAENLDAHNDSQDKVKAALVAAVKIGLAVVQSEEGSDKTRSLAIIQALQLAGVNVEEHLK